MVSFMFIPNTWSVGSQLFNTWMQAWIHKGECDNYFLKKTAQGIVIENMQDVLDIINKNRCKHLLTPQSQFAYTHILGRKSTVRFWN